MFPYRDSRLVKIILVVFFVLLLGYAYYEARAMLFGPQIEVPASTMVVHEPFTEIRGQVHYIAELRLNGTPVAVTEEGIFTEAYVLTPGANHVVLDAKHKFGRTKQKTIDIFYAPDNEALAQKSPPPSTATSSTPTEIE